MRKVSLLLALAVAGLSGFAQYNALDIKKSDAECTIRTAKVKKSTSVNNEVKAPGDLIWSEDFSDTELWSADPSEWDNGWSISDDAGIGGWQYMGEDSAYTGAYSPADQTLINTEGVGYMHLPADFYNCVPGSWPRTMVSSPVDLDATLETGWVDISEVEGGIVLSYATWLRYCCNSSTTKLDVSITTDGDEWTTYSGKDLDVTLGTNEFPSTNAFIHEIKISSVTAGADQVKIQFRFHGGSHYFWSIDDITLTEAEANDIHLKDKYADFRVNTTSVEYFNQYNNNYSEVPADFLYYPQLGALIGQKGNNATDATVIFSIDSLELPLVGTSTWDATTTIATFGDENDVDTVLHTDTNIYFFYNKQLTAADFTGNLMDDGIPYRFMYEATSTNEDADLDNNKDTLFFNQTWGRFSYHSQPSHGADHDGDIGNTWQGVTPIPGDAYANYFQMYQDDEESFKIYGLRVFIPDVDRVTFDAAGNGSTIHPVVHYYDANANSGDGAFVEIEDITAEPYTLNSSDKGEWVYLQFETDDVENYDFLDGNYYVGIEVDNYNGEFFTIGVDETQRQGKSHFRMRLEGDESFSWYIGAISGSGMIDAYTKLDQYQFDQTGVKEVNKTTLDKVTVYPNPTSGIVNIKNVENSTISVYTITGNLVQTIENTDVNTTINLAGLAKGYYLVKVVTENEVVTKKVNLK